MADVHPNAGRQAGGAAPAGARRPDPLVNVRERLFHTLFFRITLAYARGCPRWLRRLLEMMILIKAVCCFLILAYIHLAFARHPVRCLEEVKGSWPRDGILRVEIMRGPPENYGIEASYEKERQMQTIIKSQDEIPAIFHFNELFESWQESGSESGDEETEEEDDVVPITPTEPLNQTEPEQTEKRTVFSWFLNHFYVETKEEEEPEIPEEEEQQPDVLIGENGTNPEEIQSKSEIGVLNEDVSDLEKVRNAVWPEDEYIVEYSLEYGFLRLSPATRQKLNITVQILVLDPATNSCFGDGFSQFILQHFLGYDDVLMSSIKSLAEHEDNKGFLRNVVTGVHYHFKSRFTYPSAYIVAGLVMVLFTVVISMLLRYSQHQIFVFIVELLQMLEFNTAISFPAAPILTVILALVGMEAIMSEFFEDSTTAFYIIVIVWIADQYDAICCHTSITKRYWLRFFFLYHFSFYAYHYRFSGQYSTLALVTMWLFTQHAMIYFFHHYELPVILQQAQIQDLLMRNQDGGAPLRITPGTRIMANGALNNNNNNLATAANGQQRAGGPAAGAMRRVTGFNLGGFQFRFGLVVATHQQRAGGPPPTPAAPATTEPQAAEAGDGHNSDHESPTREDSEVRQVSEEVEESLEASASSTFEEDGLRRRNRTCDTNKQDTTGHSDETDSTTDNQNDQGF